MFICLLKDAYTPMTPEVFIAKWTKSTTKERAAAQEHFIDLCKVLDEKTPNEADPTGEWYAFEKGVEKTGAGRGWADVWKRGHFGWEYKSKSGGRTSTMSGALSQLQLYALALESPPLLIVSDIDTIEIHTAFQNAVQEVHLIELQDLVKPEKLDLLRSAFKDPERLRPKRTRDQITTNAAGKFAELAYMLREDGHDPQVVAHFLNKILFCMFAEDVGILKTGLFTDIVEKGVEHPEHFDIVIKRLFQAMQMGGSFGTEIIDWFNGGLFDDDIILPLTLAQVRTVRDLARMDWSQIEPAIFGTLFERGLDPAKRSQLGAHYTDPGSIMRLVNPTIVEPLLDEWRIARTEIAKQMEHMEKVKTKAATKKRLKAASDTLHSFLERLRNFRVLDPACGSGNFLYLSLLALKDIEHRANIEAEALGLQRQNPLVGPEAVLGIELNSYAAELARVTVWIGEIQWMLSHGYSLSRDPILKPLGNIEQRDAILNEDGTESEWPSTDVIVGNPPFLGGSKMLSELGEEYVSNIRNLYKSRVPGGADLVTYWFEKARAQIGAEKTKLAGLVSTNSIRGGSNRKVLKRIIESGRIFNAWSDEDWINEGAAVRVSLICFDGKSPPDLAIATHTLLNGKEVNEITSDLSANDKGALDKLDVFSAQRLKENRGWALEGMRKDGPFDVPGEVAREWISSPNPHGKPNSNVLRRRINGRELMGRPTDGWVIDFGPHLSMEEAALYEKPFRYVQEVVRPKRAGNRDRRRREMWWLFGRSNEDLRTAISKVERAIVTARVSKFRTFSWIDSKILIDTALVAFPRSDDSTFGILHSRFHECWTLKMCTWLGKGNDPRYTPTTTFETYPFPDGLTPNIKPDEYTNPHAEAIAEAAKRLNELRENWLNPPEWVDRVPEVVEGYSERIIPKPEHDKELKKRTLTNLYNQRPEWLENAHRALDEAVAAAYGWSADLSDDEVLGKLLELNLSRP